MAKRGPKGPSKWTVEKIEELADHLEDLFLQDHTIMIMEQLCFKMSIPLQYISLFSGQNDNFSEIIKTATPVLSSASIAPSGSFLKSPEVLIDILCFLLNFSPS